MKKRNKKVLTILLSFTMLFSVLLSGCGKDNTDGDMQKVVLNDDAPFFSFFKMEVTAILLPFSP